MDTLYKHIVLFSTFFLFHLPLIIISDYFVLNYSSPPLTRTRLTRTFRLLELNPIPLEFDTVFYSNLLRLTRTRLTRTPR